MPIKVSLVEDNPAMRETFVLALNRSAAVHCVGAYSTGEQALREIPTAPPDVVLMDIHLPEMSGVTCVARLRAILPKLQILMLTRFEESDTIFRALRAGASGYLVKSIAPDEIVQAIEQVHAGGSPMSMQIARKVIAHFQAIPRPPDDIDGLTMRELEVLQLLAKGRLQKNIASALGMSVNTLRTHLRSIYEKLHVHSRAEAVMKLIDPGNLDQDR